jgi:hypothetical protein
LEKEKRVRGCKEMKCWNLDCEKETKSKKGYCKNCQNEMKKMIKKIKKTDWYEDHRKPDLTKYSYQGLQQNFGASKRWVRGRSFF